MASRLSELDYWNSNYGSIGKVSSIKKNRFEPYSKLALLELCERFLPINEKLKFVEIGCAPGYNGIEFHRVFDYQIFGVDYSPSGCALTREVFSINGGNPNNVILADFLSDEFQERYRDHFDIVASFGLIEHFENSRESVDKHIDLLKKGGYLIITIPNIRGFFNYFGTYFFNREIIKIHNLNIMEKKEYEKLFDRGKLTTKYCGYFGVFNFGIFNVKPASSKRHLLRIIYIFQIGLDILFKRLFLGNNLQCRFFSPYLIYIGRKK